MSDYLFVAITLGRFGCSVGTEMKCYIGFQTGF